MPLHFGWGCRTFQTASQIWYTFTKCKPYHYTSVEAVEPFKPHPMSMSYICLSTFSGCGWAYGFTLTPLPSQMFPQICESWLKSYLMRVCKPCNYTLVEAVEPFKLHPMSMSFIYERFEYPPQVIDGHMASYSHRYHHRHFPRVLGISWNHTWCKWQTMPLCFGWGCRTFQTALQIRVIQIWGVWAPSQVVDGHMASQSHHYHHRCFPRFVRVGWHPTWCKYANNSSTVWLRL